MFPFGVLEVFKDNKGNIYILTGITTHDFGGIVDAIQRRAGEIGIGHNSLIIAAEKLSGSSQLAIMVRAGDGAKKLVDFWIARHEITDIGSIKLYHTHDAFTLCERSRESVPSLPGK